MKTNRDFTNKFRDHGTVTVPAGTTVTHKTAQGEDKRYHFVDEFEWVPPFPGTTDPHFALIHDLKYYGLNVPVDYITK